jgi:hypothetical protein
MVGEAGACGAKTMNSDMSRSDQAVEGMQMRVMVIDGTVMVAHM